MSTPSSILVAGDVCLDVLGLSMPAKPPQPDTAIDNWRHTGETRTHFTFGGALLLAEWVRAAAPQSQVFGPRPCRPQALSGSGSPDQPLAPAELQTMVERFKRDEIVHSLMRLDLFRAKPDAKELDTIRVSRREGFSGPTQGEPSLKILPPDPADHPAQIVVLDDTGNSFRRSPDQWPAVIQRPDPEGKLILICKLQAPLPAPPGATPRPTGENPVASLWDCVNTHHPKRQIVVVSVDDFRNMDARISRGLSWERTALDLVWQMLNAPSFAALKGCPHLIVRLGLDGAVYWQGADPDRKRDCRAWLIYDPSGIEGTGESSREGDMVGYGSVFTAALAGQLAGAGAKDPLISRPDAVSLPSVEVLEGIRAGLRAARRLLQLGFGTDVEKPRFPTTPLFIAPGKDDADFACQPIPLIPYAGSPDRGYWRLLESIFQNRATQLNRAVAMVARGAKPATPEEKEANELLRQVPTAVFAKALRTHDRREIENYRALYSLLADYVAQPSPPRPISVAVFGPPGAGKSFGVKQVAKALGESGRARAIEPLTFNLSQYRHPDQLGDAFHLVRDLVLRGKTPLVFFDEFDTTLDGVPLGWLRYFLAPMQDAEFLDARGTPHPIGPAIFIFAGGTKSTYAEFAEPFTNKSTEDEAAKSRLAFKAAKGPDFLSRLRGTLDIPGLDLNPPFDPYGPVEAFPCKGAILLRRAGILAFQLGEKAPHLRDCNLTLQVSDSVLRSLLHLPRFEHGNRSFEAMLDMSRLSGSNRYTSALLPAASHAGLHADPNHLGQLLSTDYPFPAADRETIAKAIHANYVAQRKATLAADASEPALKPWAEISSDLQESNREQADDIAIKLRTAGLWFRKAIPGIPPAADFQKQLEGFVETLAESEHDRWVAEKRRQGWIAARDMDRASRNDFLRLHNFLFRWHELSAETKDLDRAPVRALAGLLAAAGYEIVKP